MICVGAIRAYKTLAVPIIYLGPSHLLQQLLDGDLQLRGPLWQVIAIEIDMVASLAGLLGRRRTHSSIETERLAMARSAGQEAKIFSVTSSSSQNR